MSIHVQHSDKQEQLKYLFEKLVKILRFEDRQPFQLLKKATFGREAIITFDTYQLYLKGENSEATDYQLRIEIPKKYHEPNFVTSAITLQKIIFGVMTVDQAIAKQQLYIRGEFSEIIDMYKLVLSILAEAVLSHHLRNLWQEFLRTWNIEEEIIPGNYEEQLAEYDLHIKRIPTSVLEVGIE